MINYFPKKYRERLSQIEEMLSEMDEVENVDFSKIVDSSIEGADDFASEANKLIAKPISKARDLGGQVKESLLDDLQNDFDENLQNYVFLVQKKVEEDESFPFRDWFEVAESLKENITFPTKNIFDQINLLAEENKNLARDNFIQMLASLPIKNCNQNAFFKNLENTIKNFPEANLLDVLSAKDQTEMNQALQGKSVPLKKQSRFIFHYAAQLPSTSWTFKGLEGLKNTNKNKLSINFSTSNYDEIFEEFSKTEVWKKISENSENKEFLVKIFADGSRQDNQFFKQKSRYISGKASYFPESIIWENCAAFVKYILKGDVILTELFVNKLLSSFIKETQEKLMPQAMNIINLSLYYKLDKQVVGKEDVKINKLKI